MQSYNHGELSLAGCIAAARLLRFGFQIVCQDLSPDCLDFARDCLDLCPDCLDFVRDCLDLCLDCLEFCQIV